MNLGIGVLLVAVLTICYVFWNYSRIKKMDEGTEDMKDMALIIREGAATFLRTEFRVIAIVVVLLAIVFTLFVETTSAITFLIGPLMSSIVCAL